MRYHSHTSSRHHLMLIVDVPHKRPPPTQRGSVLMMVTVLLVTHPQIAFSLLNRPSRTPLDAHSLLFCCHKTPVAPPFCAVEVHHHSRDHDDNDAHALHLERESFVSVTRNRTNYRAGGTVFCQLACFFFLVGDSGGIPGEAENLRTAHR